MEKFNNETQHQISMDYSFEERDDPRTHLEAEEGVRLVADCDFEKSKPRDLIYEQGTTDAEIFMDKNGISMYEAKHRLANLEDKETPMNYSGVTQHDESKYLISDETTVDDKEYPSVRIDKRNVCLRKALKFALSASQREGFIHKIEKDDDEIDVNHQAKRRNDESKAANDFLDEATGINAMRKAGVDEEIIAKMASDYHKNFRNEYTGTVNSLKRDKFRRNLAHQVKVYDIFDIEP
jgi:hypothetical protein